MRCKSLIGVVVALSLAVVAMSASAAGAETAVSLDGTYTVTWSEHYVERHDIFSGSALAKQGGVGSDTFSYDVSYAGSATVSYAGGNTSVLSDSVHYNHHDAEDLAATGPCPDPSQGSWSGSLHHTRDVTDPDAWATGRAVDAPQNVHIVPVTNPDGSQALAYPISYTIQTSQGPYQYLGDGGEQYHIHDVLTQQQTACGVSTTTGPNGDTTYLDSESFFNGINLPADWFSSLQYDSATNTFSLHKSVQLPSVVPGSSFPQSGSLTTDVVVARVGKPTAAFTYKVHPGGTVEFDASSSHPSSAGGAAIANYHWDFGDQKTLDTSNPVLSGSDAHAYEDGTQPYQVTLTVTDAAGSTSDPVSQDVDTCQPDYDAQDGAEFAGLVACVEKALPDESPRQILMTVRQLYYGDASWTDPDPTKHTALWLAVIPCVTNTSVPDPTTILNNKLLTALQPAAAHEPLQGDDITHTFTVQDALECPSGFLPGGLVMPNYDIAGWGGDVGDAASEYTHAVLTGSPPGQATWNRYIGNTATTAAPSDDLYGDIDGLALHFAEAGASCSRTAAPTGDPQPISDVMRAYFEGTDGRRVTRIGCLRDFLGITGLSRATVASDYGPEILSFALPFYVRRYSPSLKDLPKVTAALIANSREAMGQFYDWLGNA